MTKNQKIRRVAELVAQGVTFRQIERRLAKTICNGRPGNGSTAFRLFARAPKVRASHQLNAPGSGALRIVKNQAA